LYISFQSFEGIDFGGSLANKHNVEMGCSILGSENVDCYFVNEVKENRSLFSFIMSVFLFPFGYYNGLTPKKVEEILAISNLYDYIFVNTSVLGLLCKKLKKNKYKGKVIQFYHNVESIYYQSRVPKWVPFRQVIINCAAQNDEYGLVYSDCSVGLCLRDSLIMKELYGKTFDIIAPISFPDKCMSISFDKTVFTAKRPKCYFIGSNFPANSEGILWFVENVLPFVNVDFRIIGKNMDMLKNNNECLADIPVYSNVPDLAPYFLEADFMIYPIFSGSGMKVKTCEALMYGKNILGTTETFEGYDLNPNQCGALCNSAQEYISAIQRFCDNPILRFNAFSRSAYQEKYSIESSLETFKTVFRYS